VSSEGPDRDARDVSAPGPQEFEPPSGPGRYRKVRARASQTFDAEMAADETLTAVIEVSEPGYRPSGVDVRGTITDTLFTARIRPSELAELDEDPRVVSIEIGSG
jgi:hypothetical protein